MSENGNGFMKRDGSIFFKQISPINIICCLLGLSVILNFIIFGCNLAFDYPLGDHWRWARSLLIPYINNEINFWEYLTGEFALLSHSHILTLLSMFLNFKVFHLRFDLDVYLGIGCYAASSVIIILHLKRIYAKHLETPFFCIFILAFIMVYFSLNSVNIFTWTLLSFEFLYWLMAMVLLILYDQWITTGYSKIPYLIWFVVVFFIGDAIGITALLTTISISALLLLVNLEKRYVKLLIIQLGILILCIGITVFVFPDFKKHSASKSSSLVYLVGHPVEMVHFILNCFSQSIIEVSGLKHYLGNYFKYIQLSVGLFIFILNLFCFYLYLIKKIYIRTTLPLAFLIFTAISIFGIMLTRLPTYGPEYAFVGRYNRLFQPSCIFCLFVLGESVILNSSPWDVFCKKMFILLFICVCGIQAGTVMFRWKYIDSQWRYQEKLLNATYDYYCSGCNEQFDKLNPRCRNQFCDSALSFFAERKLSFFRADFLNNEKDQE